MTPGTIRVNLSDCCKALVYLRLGNRRYVCTKCRVYCTHTLTKINP